MSDLPIVLMPQGNVAPNTAEQFSNSADQPQGVNVHGIVVSTAEFIDPTPPTHSEEASIPILFDFKTLYPDAIKIFQKGDYKAAKTCFLLLSENKDFRGDYYLGYMYANGLGVPKDLAVAFQYFQKAANGGLNRACMILAKAFAEGKGVDKDPSQSHKWYQIAALRGVPKAHAYMRSFENDITRADFDAKARQDLIEEKVLLGDCYLQSLEGGVLNLREAFNQFNTIPDDVVRLRKLTELRSTISYGHIFYDKDSKGDYKNVVPKTFSELQRMINNIDQEIKGINGKAEKNFAKHQEGMGKKFGYPTPQFK